MTEGTDIPTALYEAILAVQREVPTLQKSAINPHFKSKYVTLDALHEEVLPHLHEHGLVWVTQPTLALAGDKLEPCLGYRLIHAATGSEIEGVMPLMLAKDDPQGQGSALTYARRYSLMAVLGLVADEDDDGNAGSGRNKKPTGRKTPPRTDQGRAVAAVADTDQLAEVAALARELGIDSKADQWKTMLTEAGASGKRLSELTADQAGWVLNKLNALKQEKAA